MLARRQHAATHQARCTPWRSRSCGGQRRCTSPRRAQPAAWRSGARARQASGRGAHGDQKPRRLLRPGRHGCTAGRGDVAAALYPAGQRGRRAQRGAARRAAGAAKPCPNPKVRSRPSDGPPVAGAARMHAGARLWAARRVWRPPRARRSGVSGRAPRWLAAQRRAGPRRAPAPAQRPGAPPGTRSSTPPWRFLQALWSDLKLRCIPHFCIRPKALPSRTTLDGPARRSRAPRPTLQSATASASSTRSPFTPAPRCSA